MDDMNIAYVNPKVIAWAFERRGIAPEEIANTTVTAGSIRAWINGDNLPTEAQAEWLADRLRIPYLVLFLSSYPPDFDKISLPDLRTVGGRGIDKPSIDFIEVVNDVLRRQDWFRENQFRMNSKPLTFVGRFTVDDDAIDVAAAMREALNFDKPGRGDFRDHEELLKELTKRAERLGILVMRSGRVGHSPNRPLNPREFRGFASSDSLAPVVFVNDRDSKAAQNFTLAHELAHIWIGASGISNVSMKNSTSPNKIEQFCNSVAAEFLVPEADFKAVWSENDPLWNNVRRVCYAFKVSSLVALLRAYENGYLDYPVFQRAFDDEEEEFEKISRSSDEDEKQQNGPPFWSTFPWRVSNLFAHTLAEGVRSERVTYSEAARLLKVSASTFETYLIQEIGT